MRFFKKFTGLFAVAMFLLPTLGQAYTINGNLDVRGNIVGGSPTLADSNLSLSLSGGTLTVQCIGTSGSAATCSTSNPGWVTIGHTTAGQRKSYKITSSITFDDDSAGDSDFQGTGTCSWGTTAAVAWGNAAPLLIGVMSDGTTPVIVLSRLQAINSGASSNIGYKDVCPSSAAQGNVIALTATNITTSHANQTITWLGAIRATKSSSDDWTFSAFDSGDGIGVFYNYGIREFDCVTGQMGATSGKYFADNGGTAPTYTATNSCKYRLPLNSNVMQIEAFFDNAAGGTAGAGGQSITFALPLAYKNAGFTYRGGDVRIRETSGTDTLASFEIPTGSALANFIYQQTISTQVVNNNNNDQSSASRTVNISAEIPVF